jgi:hypothetical protein
MKPGRTLRLGQKNATERLRFLQSRVSGRQLANEGFACGEVAIRQITPNYAKSDFDQFDELLARSPIFQIRCSRNVACA